MTVGELFSVQKDNNKLRSLYIELARHEDFNPYKGNVITDMPKGNGGKNFIDWYVEEGERIRGKIDFYKKKLQEDRDKVDAYIAQAPYPECDIIRYRVINDLSWDEIGDLVGYDRRQAARKFWAYIKDARNAQNAHSKV